ncbi:hypothetical protein BVX98_01740, partial [bacterium F11]
MGEEGFKDFLAYEPRNHGGFTTDSEDNIYVGFEGGIIRRFSNNGNLIREYSIPNPEDIQGEGSIPSLVVKNGLLYYVFLRYPKLMTLNLATGKAGPTCDIPITHTPVRFHLIEASDTSLVLSDIGLPRSVSSASPSSVWAYSLIDNQFSDPTSFPIQIHKIQTDAKGNTYLFDGDSGDVFVVDANGTRSVIPFSDRGLEVKTIEVDFDDNLIIGLPGSFVTIAASEVEKFKVPVTEKTGDPASTLSTFLSRSLPWILFGVFLTTLFVGDDLLMALAFPMNEGIVTAGIVPVLRGGDKTQKQRVLTLAEFRAIVILVTLLRTNGSIIRARRILGIDRWSFLRFLNEMGVPEGAKPTKDSNAYSLTELRKWVLKTLNSEVGTNGDIFISASNDRLSLEMLERKYIAFVLGRNEFVKRTTASKLGITTSTLQRHIERKNGFANPSLWWEGVANLLSYVALDKFGKHYMEAKGAARFLSLWANDMTLASYVLGDQTT